MKKRILGGIGTSLAALVLIVSTSGAPASADEQPGLLDPLDDLVVQIIDLLNLGQQLKPEEAIPATEQIVKTLTFDAQRVIVSHATNSAGSHATNSAGGRHTVSAGGKRTVFSLMAWEPDLNEWYPAEQLDRPSNGEFSWASFDLANGQSILVWDELPVGAQIVAAGQLINSGLNTGSAVLTQVVDEAEVVLQ